MQYTKVKCEFNFVKLCNKNNMMKYKNQLIMILNYH